jgi:hypothetical protein
VSCAEVVPSLRAEPRAGAGRLAEQLRSRPTSQEHGLKSPVEPFAGCHPPKPMVNGRRADENATPPLDKVNPPFGQGHRSQGGPRRSHATSATNRGKPVGPSVRECGERIETGLGSTGSLASTPAEVASCRFICSSRAEAEADDTQQRVTDRADADEDEHTGHGHADPSRAIGGRYTNGWSAGTGSHQTFALRPGA